MPHFYLIGSNETLPQGTPGTRPEPKLKRNQVMKTIILTAAAIALAAPVFAGSADLAREHFLQSHETGDGPKVIRDTSAGDVNAVIAHFAQDREMGDGPRVRQATPSDVIVSTSNSSLTEFAKMKLDNDERGFN